MKKRLYLHKRLQYQKLPVLQVDPILKSIPDIVPFPGNEYLSFLFVLDWDHLIPSKKIVGRIHAFYSEKSERIAVTDYKLRHKTIDNGIEYPEFDIEDYSDIPADESYVCFLSPQGIFKKAFFISQWKQNIQSHDKEIALELIKVSDDYEQLISDFGLKCGPLRVISWVSPFQSKLPVWTIDVRFVTFCESKSFWGKQFLVDPLKKKILLTKDFNMRA